MRARACFFDGTLLAKARAVLPVFLLTVVSAPAPITPPPPGPDLPRYALSAPRAVPDAPEPLPAPRLGFFGGYGAFATYPKLLGDSGPAAMVGVTPWASGLSRAGRSNKVQWTMGFSALAAKSLDDDAVFTSLTPHPGFDIHFAQTYSMGVRFAPALLAQVGRDPVAGVSIFTLDFLNSLRTSKNADDRFALILRVHGAGLVFASDSGNDCPGCYGGVFVALGYETGG